VHAHVREGKRFIVPADEKLNRQVPETEQAQDAQWQTEATKVKTREACDFCLRNRITA